MLTRRGEAHFPAAIIIHASLRSQLAAPIRYDHADACATAHLAFLNALSVLDEKFNAVVATAVEAVYADNCVEVEEGKFRCLLSGKLFKEPTYVRKHIDNKHPAALLDAKICVLESKFDAYFAADTVRAAAMPPPPPLPPRFPREVPDDRRSSFGEVSYGGKGYVGGKGHGCAKGGGKSYGGGKGYDKGGMSFSGGDGQLATPPEGAKVINRRVVTYRDLDAPDVDDLFS